MDKEEFNDKINHLEASLNKLDLEISGKLDGIDEQIHKLKEQFKEQSQEEYKRPRVGNNKNYYYVGSTRSLMMETDQRDITDNRLYDCGNYFETVEEAEAYRDNLVTKQQLKDLALRLNKGIKIDWRNESQPKYAIWFDYGDGVLDFLITFNSQTLGQIYCLDENFLKIAKKEIGIDMLVDLIKSGI